MDIDPAHFDCARHKRREMSAVAATEHVPAPPALEVVAPSPAHVAEQEMYRWMLWFGLPSLVAAIFVAIVFATDTMWWISGAIAGVIGAVAMLIWLAMSSCTNRD
jgi:hypothetical protein